MNGLAKGLNQNEGRGLEIITAMETIEEFVEIEPRLGRLRDEVLKIMGNSPGNCTSRDRLWSSTLKPRFERLVGFGAEKAELSSSEVYNIVYQDFIRILKI